ncbi:MAG: DUF2339 domain-containing protein [bacterium]
MYDVKWLAVLGLIGGFFTPVVLSSGSDRQVELMIYMTVLNIGILFISFFKRWDLLNYLGSSFTWLLFSVWFFRSYQETKFWPTAIFITIFFLIYALVPFVYYFVKPCQDCQEQLSGFFITIPNAFIAFGYSFATFRCLLWIWPGSAPPFGSFRLSCSD